ncbi:pilus assembly protein CpaF [Paenibacillus alvei]|uniref:pilus assembly protein CpaF n=1 Tax=Paenibacillus TaxID=44249 RepID=UPI00227F4CF0|nr:pilus assembly protein CpaF [Paenibacillus alvei]
MDLNAVLIVVTSLCILVLVGALYLRAKRETPDVELSDKLTLDKLLDIVKYSLADLVKDENFSGLADEEFESMYKRRARILDAMRNCVYGIDSAKLIVQDLIRSIISDTLKTEEEVLEVYDFHANYMEPRIKFEILMYFYKKQFGKDALSEMIQEYNLDRERFEIEDKSQASYLITNEDIDEIYAEKNFELTYPVMLDILSIIIYQKYKGFGIIDTLREMNINGFNCGTSGSILSALLNKEKKIMKAPRSVWLYFNGKYIHLRFLNFNSEEELRRIVQLLCRYNNPGPLTEKRGYLVNTMYDKSRVLALRPPAAEYWAVFVRKFTLSDSSLPALIDKPYVNKAFLAIQLVQYLMMGQVTCGFTGRQGAGKTVMMTAAVKYIDPRYTIRVLEMAPEMYLRELYPERNILSVQETEYVSASELQDALKKSDAAVSIVGEVATDPIAARMIQMGQVASIFTIFSHHANLAEQLVYAIRNSLVNAGGFSGNMITAEQQVIDVIRVDIHLNYTTDGRRYIERISEIVKLDVSVPYPDYDKGDPVHSMNEITKEYYTRQTDRKTFTTRDILKYNLDTNTYETYDWFTTELTKKMLDVMPLDHVKDFKKFILDNWRL